MEGSIQVGILIGAYMANVLERMDDILEGQLEDVALLLRQWFLVT